MKLRDRLAWLERRVLPGGGKRQPIVILGGLPPGDGEDGFPYTAEDGAARWTRNPTEPFATFKARVMADPIETTTGVVVFGGLPD